MTQRYDAFVVTLEADMRSDDAEPILNAIRHIKGVLAVEPHEKSSVIDEMIMRRRLASEIGDELFNVMVFLQTGKRPSSSTE